MNKRLHLLPANRTIAFFQIRLNQDMGSYRRAITRPCEKTGVPSWHPHQLRHNAVTSLRKQHGIEMAQIILGHSTAFTTEIYAEHERAAAVEVIAKMG